MSLRIISGIYGGRIIATPATSRTHPMGDRIRSSLANILGNLEGVKVLDTFAGSGSIGFECLSHGASQVTFIEKDRVAQSVITENIALLGVQAKAKLIRASVSAWDETASDEMFDLIIADPPYHDLQLSSLKRLGKHLSDNGQFVLSWPTHTQPPSIEGLRIYDERNYGDANLLFYKIGKG